MRSCLLPLTVLAFGLSACASTPKAETLVAGIDKANMKATAPDAVRAPSDPVCVRFYSNAQSYLTTANTPSQGSRFMTNLGVSVLASVVGGGVGTGISSQVGRYAVQSATTQAIYQGSGIAMNELSKDSKAEAQVIATAAKLGCPVALKGA